MACLLPESLRSAPGLPGRRHRLGRRTAQPAIFAAKWRRRAEYSHRPSPAVGQQNHDG